MQRPTATDESLRNKVEQGITLTADDRPFVVAYKHFFIGDADPQEATLEVGDMLSRARAPLLQVGPENNYLHNIMKQLRNTLQHEPEYYDEQSNTLSCENWTVSEWCNYLESKIRLKQDDEAPYLSKQDAEGITQEMERDIRAFQNRYFYKVPSQLRQFESLQAWIDKVRTVDLTVKTILAQSEGPCQAICRKGWNVDEEAWYGDDHPVWVYRYWREVIGISIPNEPSY